MFKNDIQIYEAWSICELKVRGQFVNFFVKTKNGLKCKINSTKISTKVFPKGGGGTSTGVFLVAPAVGRRPIR